MQLFEQKTLYQQDTKNINENAFIGVLKTKTTKRQISKDHHINPSLDPNLGNLAQRVKTFTISKKNMSSLSYFNTSDLPQCFKS